MFFEEMGFSRKIEFKFQRSGQFPFENNFKGTKNCPATQANTNEPSM